MREAYEEACENSSAKPRWIDGVTEALAEVSKHSPLALITRLHLPGFPGTSLIAALKHSSRHRAIPIGVVTCDPEKAEEELGLLRPNGIIGTPDLVQNLRRFLEVTGIRDATPSGDPPVKLKGRILLAEDVTTLQKLVGSILHVAGAEVVTVPNGVDAIVAVTDEPFDLILMDLEMPKMDGRTATQAIRSMGMDVPIVAFTANDSADFRAEAAGLGFNGVLGKAISRAFLLESISSYMNNKPDAPGE